MFAAKAPEKVLSSVRDAREIWLNPGGTLRNHKKPN